MIAACIVSMHAAAIFVPSERAISSLRSGDIPNGAICALRVRGTNIISLQPQAEISHSEGIYRFARQGKISPGYYKYAMRFETKCASAICASRADQSSMRMTDSTLPSEPEARYSRIFSSVTFPVMNSAYPFGEPASSLTSPIVNFARSSES